MQRLLVARCGAPTVFCRAQELAPAALADERRVAVASAPQSFPGHPKFAKEISPDMWVGVPAEVSWAPYPYLARI